MQVGDSSERCPCGLFKCKHPVSENKADSEIMALSIIKVLSVTLGLFFIFVGVLKLSPVINKELYKEMVSLFRITNGNPCETSLNF